MIAVSAKGPAAHAPASTTNNPCVGKHKTRLLIGEGSFTFAEALIAKHDQRHNHDKERSLAKSIIATELKGIFNATTLEDVITCSKCPTKLVKFVLDDILEQIEDLNISDDNTGENVKLTQCEKCKIISKRIETLRNKGVDVRLGFDGTKIHEIFPQTRFKRIHWNVPHDGSDFTDQTLPPIIKAFFASCTKAQNAGDRVHVTLPQPAKNPANPSLDKKIFYQGYMYDIARAATLAGYKIIKKRKFELSRYPGYIHERTNASEPADVMNEGAREFIFEKIDEKKFQEIREESKGNSLKVAKKLAALSTKKYSIKVREFYKEPRFYYSCSSDDDSSDYAE